MFQVNAHIWRFKNRSRKRINKERQSRSHQSFCCCGGNIDKIRRTKGTLWLSRIPLGSHTSSCRQRHIVVVTLFPFLTVIPAVFHPNGTNIHYPRQLKIDNNLSSKYMASIQSHEAEISVGFDDVVQSIPQR